MNPGNENALERLVKLRNYPELQSKSKYAMIEITLLVVAAAFEEVSKRAPEMKKEIEVWNEGRKCGIGVLPKGPAITLQKKEGRILFIGKGLKDPDVSFLFKNLDAAFMIFTAQMSSHQAVAENRVLVDGNNAYAMEMNRTLAIVQTYLFPKFVVDMIFKRPPKLGLSHYMRQGQVYAALLPALVRGRFAREKE